jgi:hypothetical protein
VALDPLDHLLLLGVSMWNLEALIVEGYQLDHLALVAHDLHDFGSSTVVPPWLWISCRISSMH